MSNKANGGERPLALAPDYPFVPRPRPRYIKVKQKRKRQPMITERATAIICEAIRSGCKMKLAASMAGVSDKTVAEWLVKADKLGTEPYATFARRYNAALDELQASLVAAIRDQARVDWRAAARMLAMHWPEEYAMNRAPQTQVSIAIHQEISESREIVRERLLAMAEREAPELIEAEVVDDDSTG